MFFISHRLPAVTFITPPIRYRSTEEFKTAGTNVQVFSFFLRSILLSVELQPESSPKFEAQMYVMNQIVLVGINHVVSCYTTDKGNKISSDT